MPNLLDDATWVRYAIRATYLARHNRYGGACTDDPLVGWAIEYTVESFEQIADGACRTPRVELARLDSVPATDHSPAWLDWSAKTILALAAFGLWELLVTIGQWFVER